MTGLNGSTVLIKTKKMAIISKEKFFLKNVGEVMKIIRYVKGQFTITLPDRVCEDLVLKDRDKEIRADSKSSVNTMFSAKVKEWENAITKEEKVILFSGKFQGALLKEEKWKDWNNGVYRPYYKPNTNNSESQSIWHFIKEDISPFDESGLGLLLSWAVYRKKTINGKSDYKFISGRSLNISRDYNINKYTEIEYSSEREKFFLELDESFARMIHKVYMALGELTPEKLMLLSDSGIKLLN